MIAQAGWEMLRVGQVTELSQSGITQRSGGRGRTGGRGQVGTDLTFDLWSLAGTGQTRWKSPGGTEVTTPPKGHAHLIKDTPLFRPRLFSCACCHSIGGPANGEWTNQLWALCGCHCWDCALILSIKTANHAHSVQLHQCQSVNHE